MAAALHGLPGVVAVPDPPQTPLFHLHFRIDGTRAVEAALALAEETRIWFGDTFLATAVPAVQKLEIAIGEPSLEARPEEARALFGAPWGAQT